MITIIDETVMLRYLLQDDARQARRARNLIEERQSYTYPEFITRVAVTLRDVYEVPRGEIAEALETLLGDVMVAEEDVVRLACKLFGDTLLDFTDCMMVARSTLRGHKVLSFDKPIVQKMLH